jgi:hypothetical protein
VNRIDITMHISTNNLLHIISIDSFFNGLLFLLIFNIKLSKQDRIEYYNTFILSIKIRYLYFGLVWITSLLLSIMFFNEINISSTAIPIFIYLFYNLYYFQHIVDWIYKKCHLKIQEYITFGVYHIIQFLCRTILIEESNIKQAELAIFYNRFGFTRLNEFAQSFVVACVYEYISSHYQYLSYIFQFNNATHDIYEKKQHILGLLNSKDWDKLLHSSTIHQFFYIYKNSNNRQISKFINYQLNRLKYRVMIFFSVWSIVGITEITYSIPLFFYYIYMSQWNEHIRLFTLLSIFSMVCPNYILSIVLFIVPKSFFYKLYESLYLLHISVNRIIETSIVCCMAIIINNLWIKFFYFIMALLLYRQISISIVFFFVMGYISNYNVQHCIYLWCISTGFTILYSTYYYKPYKNSSVL